MNNNTLERKEKMELNRLTISLISILLTIAVCLATFSYQTGSYNSDLKNLKEQQVSTRIEIKEEIKRVEDAKADKVVVELILKKLDASILDNSRDHEKIIEKLDNIINNYKSKI